MTPSAGTVTPWVEELPGYPDNISTAPDGRIWVAMVSDRNAVAEKWEEAKTMASLTGEEDLLLGYAKAYAQNSIQGRTERILRERTA